MAQPGDVIENPRTGERIVFRRPAQETNGELLEVEMLIKPNSFAPVNHVHAKVEERVEIVSGSVRFRLGKEEQSLGPGESIVIPRGTPHTFWNDGDGEVRFRVEVRPAGAMEAAFETTFRLYRDGKTNKRGSPSLLQAALLARESETFLAGPPIVLQRAGLALLTPVARLLGYRTRYPEEPGSG